MTQAQQAKPFSATSPLVERLRAPAYNNQDDAMTVISVGTLRQAADSIEELLAALKQLHTEADRLGNYLSDKGQGATMLGLACHKARAAIAKAEGR